MADPTAPAGTAGTPTRAELRRQREAQEAADAAAAVATPEPALPASGRAAQRQARVSGAAVATAVAAGRAAQRQAREKAQKSPNPLVVLLTAWWFWPILALVVICGYFGITSATTPKPSDQPVVITTVPPLNQ